MGIAVQVCKLGFRYKNAAQLTLDIPHWQCDAGERVFISGASGCGKSSFIKVLAGLLLPQTGTVEVFGCDLAGLTQARRDRFRAENIGLVFQQFNLIPFLTVYDNLRLAGSFAGASQGYDAKGAKSLLRAVNIGDDLFRRRVVELSVGQQQRVAIARALVNKPQLILADEPTSALDEDNTEAFLDLLFALADEQGSTLIFASHDMRLRSRFSREEHFADILTQAGPKAHAERQDVL